MMNPAGGAKSSMTTVHNDDRWCVIVGEAISRIRLKAEDGGEGRDERANTVINR